MQIRRETLDNLSELNNFEEIDRYSNFEDNENQLNKLSFKFIEFKLKKRVLTPLNHPINLKELKKYYSKHKYGYSNTFLAEDLPEYLVELFVVFLINKYGFKAYRALNEKDRNKYIVLIYDKFDIIELIYPLEYYFKNKGDFTNLEVSLNNRLKVLNDHEDKYSFSIPILLILVAFLILSFYLLINYIKS